MKPESETGTSIPVKQQAREIADHLPDNVTWAEVMYELELRASIDRGVADAGKLTPVSDVMREFALSE
jgi:hypothetical protein